MNIVLIVDPFSTGRMYAPVFEHLGYECYAILSNTSVPNFFKNSVDFTHFKDRHFLSAEEAKQRFKPKSVKAVVVGAETGVFVGEQLAAYFQVKGNNPAFSQLRRDKFAMQSQLKHSGVDSIESEVIVAECDLPTFKSLSGYVLKPLNSAGTDGVVFCADKTALYQHIQQLNWGSINITGEKNNAFLVQEFIDGEEFVVDMVVDNDFIHTVSLCRYQKGEHNGSRFVYEYMEMLDPHLAEFTDLVDYAHQCTHALGFEFGPVHMEIMRTKDRIVMIEAGGRLHGGVAPKIFQQCYKPDLLTQAVNCYHKNTLPIPTSQIQFARVVFMINNRPNAMFNTQLFTQQSQSLGSFYDMVVSSFEYLPLTIDLITCPCYVLLVSSCQQQIKEDTQRLNLIFQACLY